jgi:ribonuclease BN (tRNA processing enzyme)
MQIILFICSYADMHNNAPGHTFPVLPLDAAAIVAAAIQQDRRVLLFGPMGAGKSTLAAQIAATLSLSRRSCICLNADPGSPAFGPPGCVAMARWQQDAWHVIDHAALCTLDAGRFRLPLVLAIRSLTKCLPDATVLIDSPGVVRGVAGRELLLALADATAADTVIALTAHNRPPPLVDELQSLSAQVYLVHAAAEARRPGKRTRARLRTEQWNTHLASATEQQLQLTTMHLVGTPPLTTATSGWTGKQIALLAADRTCAMGEVLDLRSEVLTAMISGEATGADTLLLRDAVRSADGYLETAIPYASERFGYLPPADVLPASEDNNGPRVAGRVGAVDVALVNGVFGDPLLHVRMRHQRRSLLFDLGNGSRLPARIAHQVSDVFISHAHMDHIGGFLWLLRSRIGDYPSCRLYGPPGLAQHIAGFLQAILWDRVEEHAPTFEVMELHDNRLKQFHLQAGTSQAVFVGEQTTNNGELLDENGFRVRGVTLDHHGTPVLAYAYEAEQQFNIRKDRLKARGLEPGAWLNKLKHHLTGNDETAMIQMPDGSQASAGTLAEDLVLVTPGKKFVYATDLADTPDNRQKLVGLAQHAHTFFCESTYLEDDARYATMNGHLTTRACGEIGTEAGVTRLVPFHFSRRYLHKAEQVYDELDQYCPRVLRPIDMTLFKAAKRSDAVIEFNDES